MPKVTIYKSKDGWRWHRMSGSDIVSESGEGYTNRGDALDQAKAVARPGDTVELQDGKGQSTLQYVVGGGDASGDA